MKCYYVMIHFDGPYVSGFVVPQANDEPHALKQLRALLWAQYKLSNDQYKSDDFSTSRLKHFIRSLKRPWRFAGEYRNEKLYKHARAVSQSRVVRIIEMNLPVISGYWLKDIASKRELCNIHRPNPAERQ